MTKELSKKDKQLILNDLCPRLPYRPKAAILHGIFEPETVTVIGYSGRFVDTINSQYELERVRLYLRPMSSMTDEERDKFREVGGVMSHNVENDIWAISAFSPEAYKFLNSHFFDYNNLIPAGLAWEGNEDMYTIAML